MSTHVDKVYFQEPSIEWGYHICQNRRVLLAWDYDTAVLSYISLKPGCRTYYLTTQEERRKRRGEKYIHVFPSFIFVFVKQVIAQEIK